MSSSETDTRTFTREERERVAKEAHWLMHLDGDHAEDVSMYFRQACINVKKGKYIGTKRK